MVGRKFFTLLKCLLFSFLFNNVFKNIIIINIFSVLLKVNMSWTDRRIDFLHLRNDVFQNSVSKDLRTNLWIPEVGELHRFLKMNLQHHLVITFFQDFPMLKQEVYKKMSLSTFWFQGKVIQFLLSQTEPLKIQFIKVTKILYFSWEGKAFDSYSQNCLLTKVMGVGGVTFCY